MPDKNINRNQTEQNLLASMLDWGLGHTTRTIPILKEFHKKGFHITIAGNNAQINFLKKELPEADFVFLKGYNIRYSSSKFWFTLKIFIQIPQIIFRVTKEHIWLKKYIRNHKTDIILSDNRPGFFNRSVYSIYMTHQLTVKTKCNFTSLIATYSHQFFVRKFDVCWVPDTEENTLAGELSASKDKQLNLKYIGPVSRFAYNALPRHINLLVILSGPEPLRTSIENKLIGQLKNSTMKIVFIRGTNNINPNVSSSNSNIKFINQANSRELNTMINQSELIVSRSGYTTIMDLVKTKARALLIPTPGQPEQEYLAKSISEKRLFLQTTENGLNILNLLEEEKKFTPRMPTIDFEMYKSVIDHTIDDNR